jgi:chromosome segregation ATPase
MKPRYEIVDDEQTQKPRYEIVDDNQLEHPYSESIGALNRIKQGAGIVGSDIASLPGKIGNVAFNAINAAPSQIGGLANQIAFNRPRILGNMAVAASNVVKGTLNIPYELRKYLAHIGFADPNKIEDTLHLEHEPIGEEIQKLMGPKEPGDELIQNLTQLAPFLPKTGELISSTASKITPKIIGKEDPLLKAQEVTLEHGINQKQQEIEQANLEHEIQAQAHNQAVAQAKKQLNLADENRMEFKLNEQNKKLNEAKQNNEILKNKLSQIQPLPESPKIPNPIPKPELGEEPIEPSPLDESHLVRINNAMQQENEAANNVDNAIQHHENISNLSNQAEDNIGEYLNKGASHDTRVGSALDKRIDSIENYWKDAYSRFKNNIKDLKVEMPEKTLKNFDIDMDAIRKHIGAARVTVIKNIPSEENDELSHLMSIAPTSKDINASDFLDKYQDFKNARYDLSQRAKEPMSRSERKKLFDAYNNTQDIEDSARKALEDGLGPYSDELKRINHGYSTQVYPLRGNSVVKQIKNKEALPDNMIKTLRTNEEGMPLLRELIKQDPEILRNIVGQRFEVDPTEIYEPNERTREYINEMPQLQRLINSKSQIDNAVNEAKTHLENAKEQHKNAKEQVKQTIGESKQAQKEAERAAKEYQLKIKERQNKLKEHESQVKSQEKAYQAELKSHEAKINAHEKEKANIQKQIDKYESDIKEFETQIPILEKNMNNVRLEFNKKQINLKRKNELGRQLDKMKRELSEIKKKRDESTTGLRKAIYVGYKLYKMGKKFSGV